MRKSAIILAALILATLSFASIAGAQATTTRIVFTLPVDEILSAGPCIGEDLHIEGELSVFFRMTLTPTDMDLTDGHASGHLTATGLSTGGTYQVISVGANSITNVGSGGLPFEEASTFAFRIIGSGTNNTVLSTTVFHFILTPSGDVAVDLLRTTIKCVS
jgi:uncharacterized membrane protein YtjA (UPF0391 family)